MEKKPEPKIFRIYKTFCALGLVPLGTLVAIVVGINSLVTTKPVVEFAAEFHDYSVNPIAHSTIVNVFDELRSSEYNAQLLQLLRSSSTTAEEFENVVVTRNDNLVERLAGMLATKYREYGYFTISNKSDQVLEDVELRVPNAGVYKLSNFTGETKVGDFSQAIPIDTIKPQSTLVVETWTLSRIQSLLKKDILLIHSMGSLSPIEYTKLEKNEAWMLRFSNGMILALFLIMATWFFLLLGKLQKNADMANVTLRKNSSDT